MKFNCESTNMDNKILKLSDRLHSVLFDERAPERRCVPSEDILLKVLNDVNVLMPNKLISDLAIEDYQMIFQKIINTHNYELNNIIPTRDEILLITDTFKYAVKVNGRWNTGLILNDLWVLYVLYNIISYDKDSETYLNKFKNWRRS